MNAIDNWLNLGSNIQERIIEKTPLDIKNAKTYLSELRKCLITASNNHFLNTRLDLIYKQLLLKEGTEEEGISIIYGGLTSGPKNFSRDKNLPHFERIDGGWFDFSLTIDERLQPALILAYDFELRFPATHGVEFIRFDLNFPDHDNDKRDIRSHIHPGHDDLMIHSPPMNPLEILHLFLYDLYLTDKPRAR